MKINTITSNLLHKTLETVIDLNNTGNDASMNVCMAAGAVSVTIVLYDGDFHKSKDADVLQGYSSRSGDTSIQSVIDDMEHRMNKDWYIK